MLIVAVALLAGCGGDDSKNSDQASASAPSREEAAVVEWARTLYPRQDIESASCEESGFNSVGPIFSCTLTDGRGMTSESSDWNILEGTTNGRPVAQPLGTNAYAP